MNERQAVTEERLAEIERLDVATTPRVLSETALDLVAEIRRLQRALADLR